MNQGLLTDTDFASLSIPAEGEELRLLERSIMEEGCKHPITVWNGYILDGYKRYKICRSEGVGFQVEALEAGSKEEAACWACRQKLRGLPHYSAAYRYLSGKLYLFQKAAMDKPSPASGGTSGISGGPAGKGIPRKKASSVLAAELGIDPATVMRYGKYADALEKVGELEPQLFRAVLSGTLKIPKKGILEMAQMDKKELAAIRRKALPALPRTKTGKPPEGTEKLAEGERNLRERNGRNMPRGEGRNADGGGGADSDVAIRVGIKEMPKYDPDMELKGLCLTVPTWISAIRRAERKTDMAQASEKTKAQLSAVLARLGEQARETMEAMR